MSKHLSDLRDRRLANLDSAIEYYSKRLTVYRKSMSQAKLKLNGDEREFTEAEVYARRVLDLEDIISYLKLC